MNNLYFIDFVFFGFFETIYIKTRFSVQFRGTRYNLAPSFLLCGDFRAYLNEHCLRVKCLIFLLTKFPVNKVLLFKQYFGKRAY